MSLKTKSEGMQPTTSGMGTGRRKDRWKDQERNLRRFYRKAYVRQINIYGPWWMEQKIGFIWVHVKDGKAFIYDFLIDEEFRGKGYGKQALAAMDEMLKSME